MVLYTDLLICNKSDRYIQVFFGFVVWGWVPGWWLISQGGNLCAWRPLYVISGIPWNGHFLEHVCAGGGGNVTFLGIDGFPALLLVSVWYSGPL